MRIVLIFIIIFLYTMFPLLPQASLMISYLEFSRVYDMPRYIFLFFSWGSLSFLDLWFVLLNLENS